MCILCIRNRDNVDCFQEQPVWWLRWDKTITAAQGGFIILYPDLGLLK